MAPRRSTRNLARAQPSNKDASNSRPKRGSHGFHKFKNGLLNLTPVSDDEKALCEQNSLSSDLLRLPPEVRMMIWSYALSGQTIKLAPKRRPLEMVVWSHDRFPLLRVCRQVYSEAAILPYTLNTFYFTILQHYLDYARSSLIKHVQHISMWRYSWERQGLHFPSTNARVLKTIEYAVFLVPEYMDDKDVVKKRLEDRNDGVSVTVRYLDLGTDW